MTLDELELFALVVPSSRCGLKWVDLPGDEKVRRCDRCHRHLHRVSELSVDEVIALGRRDQARARLFLRRDGTVKTGDCPKSSSVEFASSKKHGWPTVLVGVLVYLISLCGLITLAGDEIRHLFGDRGRGCGLPSEGRSGRHVRQQATSARSRSE